MDMRSALFIREKTLAELQKLTGIQMSRLSYIKNGRLNPREDEMKRIERALNMRGLIDWHIK